MFSSDLVSVERPEAGIVRKVPSNTVLLRAIELLEARSPHEVIAATLRLDRDVVAAFANALMLCRSFHIARRHWMYLLRKVLDEPQTKSLMSITSREMDVVILAMQGLTAKQSARRLGITGRTITFHIANVACRLRPRGAIGSRVGVIIPAYFGFLLSAFSRQE